MKKLVSIILICALTILLLAGCSVKDAVPADDIDDFEPVETPASGLAQALESEAAQDETKTVTLDELLADVEADEPEADEPEAKYADAEIEDIEPLNQEIAEDVPILQSTPAANAAAPAQEEVKQPFATSTPQPNTYIASYSECSGTGLGFKFRYPYGWENIPGRSTICYIQPLDNGTVYPARVAVTMKKLSHRCTDELCKSELVDFLKTIRTQYDQSTFEVDSNLNLEQKFMRNNAMSTNYLAYDGSQEVAGYVIMTYFERYVFVFHFCCAYEDFAAFKPAIDTMRDSVTADG